MAKKTTTIVEEEVTPEVSPTEEHDKKVLEGLTNDPNAPLELEPDKLDEPAKEDPKEEKVESKVEEKPLDREEIKKEVKEEVIKEIEVLKKDQTPEEKDAYDKFVDDYTAKNGKAPEWKQVASFLKDQAKEEIKAELQAEVEAEEKQEQEAQKEQETKQQELNDNLNKDWDEQLDDLVRTGKIPPVKDPNNNEVQSITNAEGKVIEQIPVEPGKRARYELFKAMYVASEERINRNDGSKPLTNLKEIYYEHYNKDKQPAGANAPIAGVRKSVSSNSGTSFKYSDIHNVPFETLLKGD